MKKVAVITGTTSGIGRAIATYYKNNCYTVIGINRRDVQVTCPLYPLDQSFTFDLRGFADKQEAIKAIQMEFKYIDALVNNAGIMFLDDLDDGRLETIAVDLHAPIHICSELLGHIREGGHIINIASVAGITGDPDVPVYAACKAGIINFTRSLAKMAAPYVRVNSISPGFFNTNLVEGDTPQELIDKVPMQREAEPTEIIPVVHMLQTSTYITGANIVIDGGLSL